MNIPLKFDKRSIKEKSINCDKIFNTLINVINDKKIIPFKEVEFTPESIDKVLQKAQKKSKKVVNTKEIIL